MGQVGSDAITTMLKNLTPGAWVTVHETSFDPDPQAHAPVSLDWTPVSRTAERIIPAAFDDPVWSGNKRNLEHRFCFRTCDLCRYYDATHPVESILRKEDNGYGRAHWRGERTPSVKLYPETNSWADFGQYEDGKYDGGDALELQCRVSGRAKRDLLKETATALREAAHQELERAAREQRGPARWVADMMSPTAWVHFDRQFTRHA